MFLWISSYLQLITENKYSFLIALLFQFMQAYSWWSHRGLLKIQHLLLYTELLIHLNYSDDFITQTNSRCVCLFYLFIFAIICICKTRILGLKEKLPKKETTWKPKYSRVQPQCTDVFLAQIVLSLRKQKVPLRGRSKMTKSQANCIQVSWLCLHSSSSQEGNLTKMAAELPYISDAWQW